MNDIVEKLRGPRTEQGGLWPHPNLHEEAADEIIRLRKYEKMIQFIANDYYELSHDKVKWQRDDWRNRCRKLIEEDNVESD